MVTCDFKNTTWSRIRIPPLSADGFSWFVVQGGVGLDPGAVGERGAQGRVQRPSAVLRAADGHQVAAEARQRGAAPGGRLRRHKSFLGSLVNRLLLRLAPQARHFRLYSQEVVELGHGVSFLLLLPAADDVCSAPGQSNPYTPLSGFLHLPLQMFELGNNRRLLTRRPTCYRLKPDKSTLSNKMYKLIIININKCNHLLKSHIYFKK